MMGFAPVARGVLACCMALSAWTANAQTAAQAPSAVAGKKTALATFAGGCFWCVEADFDKVEGVLSTTSGYLGGKVPNPKYEAVSAGTTGHTEAVQVVYDPSRVSFEKLTEYFWRTIDPTVKDRQFCDAGSQYRSGIYPHDAQQMQVALASRAALEKSKPFAAPVVTEILAATTFYAAEDYHQDYYKKNPVRYAYYRNGCGRDARLKELWGALPKP